MDIDMNDHISMNALANSSFQSLSDDDDSRNLQEAQSSPSNIEINNDNDNDNDHDNDKNEIKVDMPSTPLRKKVISEASTGDLNENVPSLNNKDYDRTTPNISIIGLEPIQSPRKSIQKILAQPVDNSPRLVIEKLVLTNFKSYAGRQEIGPFHPSFSAVVGPNGSGKSNVIDSMLFVFGFRASKMRQSKLKELIHNSESFPDLQFCQVDIHFKKIIDNYDSSGNNTNNPSIIENSDLIVSRRANKNNSSTYYINNKSSNYTEVTTLLKSEGIDLDHKRFLILQGEVEMIAQMKPKAENENDDGLLEYLEDIIGTSNYKGEIEMITTEIESLQDSYTEKEKRHEYISGEFTDIEKQKDSAISFLKLEKKLKDETLKYWHLTTHSQKNSLNRYNSKLIELNDKIKDDHALIEESKKDLSNLKDQKKKLNSNLIRLNDQITTSKKSFRTIEKEQISLNEKHKTHERKKDNIKKTLQTNLKNLKSSESELETLKENLSKYDKESDALKEELQLENDKLNKIKGDLSSQTKKYSEQIESLQKKLEPWKKSIDEKQSEFHIKNSEIELLKNQLDSIVTENEKNKLSLNSKTEQIKINNSKIESLSDGRIKLQSNIDKHKETFRYAHEELKRLESELKEISNKVEFAKTKASNFEAQNKVLAALTRLQETGRISGFYGKLGDLGVIDDKYDVAVSTGGGALSDYVVDTVDDAQNCIQYLRQNNLGFGKFIVLEKLRRFNLGKINTPENVPRLFDLIKPVDSKFAPAFYSSMYDTVVAPNLSVANRVAFGGSKRWRVVTLDGKLVDVSGTMSGGGTRVSKGAMKLVSNSSSSQVDMVSPQQLNVWKEELYQKETNFKNAEAAYRKMEQVLRTSQEEIPKMSSDILKLEMDNNNLNEDIKEHEKTLQELMNKKDQVNLLKTQIKEQTLILENLRCEKSKLEEDSKDLQNQIDQLQRTILDIGGLKLKTQTAKVQSLKESIQLKIEMKENDELKVAKLQIQIQKFNKQIDNFTNELKESETTLLDLKKSYDAKTSEVQTLEAEINKLTDKKDNIINEIGIIDDEIEKKEDQLREKSELISDSLKQINKVESIIEKIKNEISDSINAIESLEYRDVLPYVTWMDEDDPTLEKIIQKPINFEGQFSEEELRRIDLKQLGENVDSLKIELNDTTVNLDILLTYGAKKQQFLDQKEDLAISLKNLQDVKIKSEELNERRHTEFKEGFNAISSTLKVMYYLITAGGMAELEYYDSHDAFSEGIVFSVMPPKKSWRTISNLSGGEKTLASLALVFALHHYKPTPLYVMDEIDAALDFKNVSIVANYIKSRTKNAQFIVISLRNNMFELAESLVGIYKVNNMTRSATLVNKNLIK